MPNHNDVKQRNKFSKIKIGNQIFFDWKIKKTEIF